MNMRSTLLIAASAAVIAVLPAHAGHSGKTDGHGSKFEKMDLNADGAITREEAAEYRRKRIMAADADGDGAVTLAEMKAHYEKKWGDKKKDGDKAKDGKKGDRTEKHFKKWDANADGKVTAEEIDAKSDRFDKWDADGDGKVTKEEMEAAKARWKEKHKDKDKDKNAESKDG